MLISFLAVVKKIFDNVKKHFLSMLPNYFWYRTSQSSRNNLENLVGVPLTCGRGSLCPLRKTDGQYREPHADTQLII